MSESFKSRLFPQIESIRKSFRPILVGDYPPYYPERQALSGGFHIYDEIGIEETIAKMKKLFFSKRPGTNFFAVKACPNIQILKLVLRNGFGLDCASPTEIIRAELAGARPDQIMYSSNNTHQNFLRFASHKVGILNLDDITLIDKVRKMPELICFRYNPGESRQEGTNQIIGTPVNQKYGLRYDQIVPAFRLAIERGAKRFGLHTMYASNSLDPQVLAGNAKMQLEIVELVQSKLGIRFDFINIGGGLGIPYRPEQSELDIETMATLIDQEMNAFRERNGYLPELYLESGRYVTGPHGVLVGQVINVMEKHKKFIGVDFCDAADILRAPFYPAYHEVSIVGPDGREKEDNPEYGPKLEQVSIVGPLCENMHLVSDRLLPKINEGDSVVVHDTGAHGIAMSMKYNGWGASQELLLGKDGQVRRISRAETIGDLLAREI
jgi:diaminopimelate decarboxylase